MERTYGGVLAEGTQFWFHSNFAYTDGNKRIMPPRDLLEYDPTVYDLLAEVYPDHHIPTGRLLRERNSATPSDTAARSASV